MDHRRVNKVVSSSRIEMQKSLYLYKSITISLSFSLCIYIYTHASVCAYTRRGTVKVVWSTGYSSYWVVLSGSCTSSVPSSAALSKMPAAFDRRSSWSCRGKSNDSVQENHCQRWPSNSPILLYLTGSYPQHALIVEVEWPLFYPNPYGSPHTWTSIRNLAPSAPSPGCSAPLLRFHPLQPAGAMRRHPHGACPCPPQRRLAMFVSLCCKTMSSCFTINFITWTEHNLTPHVLSPPCFPVQLGPNQYPKQQWFDSQKKSRAGSATVPPLLPGLLAEHRLQGSILCRLQKSLCSFLAQGVQVLPGCPRKLSPNIVFFLCFLVSLGGVVLGV